jgi:hypothetical protein
MDPEGAVLVSGDLPMLIGRGEGEESLDGMIDEVRVWSVPTQATWIRVDHRVQVEPTAVVAVAGGTEPITNCDGG